MEIISYVQDNPRKKGWSFAIPSFSRNIKKKASADVFTSNIFSPELSTFNAQKIRNPVSVKSFLKFTGSLVTDILEFVQENVKKLLIIALVTIITGVLAFITAAFLHYQNNHTGPLALQNDGSVDIENLNRLMADFALEGIVEYDERGNLIDSDISSELSNFTQPVTYQNYKVKSGDTISGIAKKFGLANISTLISVNDIGNVRQLAAGQKLKIPSIDGIVYTVKKGDSLNSIISSHKIKLEQLLDVNELSSETLTVGQQLFLPGAAMDATALKNAMGELFIIPISAKFRWTSPFGYRIDPIANVRSFHTGTDLACPTGTPILASMSGRVVKTGQTRVYGNYVILDHNNGYQTVYMHMSKILATKGQWVSQGTRIGLVGSTGYSTGPHLHFTVYKNGKLVDPMTVLKK